MVINVPVDAPATTPCKDYYFVSDTVCTIHASQTLLELGSHSAMQIVPQALASVQHQ